MGKGISKVMGVGREELFEQVVNFAGEVLNNV